MRLERTREFITRWGRNRDDHDHMCAVEIRELWGEPNHPTAVCDCGLADTVAALAEIEKAEAALEWARIDVSEYREWQSLGSGRFIPLMESLAAALAAFGSDGGTTDE